MGTTKIDYNPFHLRAVATEGDKTNDCSATLAGECNLLPVEGSKKFKALATLEPGDIASLSCKKTLYAEDSPLGKLLPEIEAATVRVAAYDSDKDTEMAQHPGAQVNIDFSTGIVFDQGYMVVNRHLKPGLNYYVQLSNDQSFPLKIIYADDKDDLALARIENPDRNYHYSTLAIGRAHTAENDTAIVAPGYAMGRHKLVYSIGSVALTTKDDEPDNNCGSTLQKRLLLNTAYGQSGSPVINLITGDMIGIISGANSPRGTGLPLNYNSLMVRPQELVNFYKQAENYISTHKAAK